MDIRFQENGPFRGGPGVGTIRGCGFKGIIITPQTTEESQILKEIHQKLGVLIPGGQFKFNDDNLASLEISAKYPTAL